MPAVADEDATDFFAVAVSPEDYGRVVISTLAGTDQKGEAGGALPPNAGTSHLGGIFLPSSISLPPGMWKSEVCPSIARV